MFETSFESIIKDKIELADLLIGLSDEDAEAVHKLYLEKKEIMNKNGLFANIQINKINKKIDKIRSKYSKEELDKYKNSLETHSIFENNQNKKQ